jgi:nucleotide-binding universal stress UspA family protein
VPDIWAVRYGLDSAPPPVQILEGMRAAARQLVGDLLAARPELAAQVEVTVEVKTGNAGEVLVDASAGADTLVVGHRGRGAVASAVLGSVGLHCVLHARCPVTVVRPVSGSARTEPELSDAIPAQV